MTRRSRLGLAVLGAVLLSTCATWGQGLGPTFDVTSPRFGTVETPSLGTLPGSSEIPIAADRPGFEGILGGRAGASVPRVPVSVTRPRGEDQLPRPLGIEGPDRLRISDVPLFGPLSLPEGPDPEGPLDGLTLDAAIERVVSANPTLRALRYEIPQARADIITAGLRANPVLYADTQFIPYGRFSDERPGGPTQYDLNITYPLDVSGKRRARIKYAQQTLKTLEAQYQEAVRLSIENVYIAFVDVLAARETVRLARASVSGLEEAVDLSETLRGQGFQTEADVNRVRVQLGTASIVLADAEETLRRANRALGLLIDIHPAAAEVIEVRGTLHNPIPEIPSPEELTELALRARPDLAAYRLGIGRAEAQVDLELANRFSDVFVLYQPYTYQDNAPYNLGSATSWALGVTVPLPLYNRNQGNIQRARLNVGQSRAELEAIEKSVVVEVRQAEQEYRISRLALRRIEMELLPAAQQILDSSEQLFRGGEIDAVAYLGARREYNDVIRQYRDLLVRHRRSMLSLNTVVGQRVLP